MGTFVNHTEQMYCLLLCSSWEGSPMHSSLNSLYPWIIFFPVFCFLSQTVVCCLWISVVYFSQLGQWEDFLSLLSRTLLIRNEVQQSLMMGDSISYRNISGLGLNCFFLCRLVIGFTPGDYRSLVKEWWQTVLLWKCQEILSLLIVQFTCTFRPPTPLLLHTLPLGDGVLFLIPKFMT